MDDATPVSPDQDYWDEPSDRANRVLDMMEKYDAATKEANSLDLFPNVCEK